MNFHYLYYKILRVLHLISELDFKRKTAFYSPAYKVISRSKLFDKKWYLHAYPEVKDSGLSPIEHYINYGLKDGKKTSEDFNPEKVFTQPYPHSYYTLQSSRAKKNAFIEHKYENKIENFKQANRKILLISHEFTLTGAPRALFNLAKVLQQHNYEPVVISPSFGDMEKELKAEGIEYYVEPLLLMKLLFQENKMREFFNSFEILFFNTMPSLRFANFIQSPAKRIAWIHEARFASERESANGDISNLFKTIDEVYSVGEYSKSFTDNYIDKSKSHTLLYGIKPLDFEKIATKPKTDKLSFGIVGHCSERKGHDIFVEAIQRLPQEIKENCLFKIIGKVDKRKFSQKIKKIAEQEGIICTGQLSYEESLKEINSLDCIVCPSRDDPMPMVCTEAFMLEKVVLTSKQTGTAFFIEHGVNGFIFEADSEALKECMLKVYNHKQNLKEIGKSAKRIYVDNFTEELFERNVLEVINNTICDQQLRGEENE